MCDYFDEVDVVDCPALEALEQVAEVVDRLREDGAMADAVDPVLVRDLMSARRKISAALRSARRRGYREPAPLLAYGVAVKPSGYLQ